jgi:hypothetical protein
MIYLTQNNAVEAKKINNLLSKVGYMNLRMNADLIQRDKEKVESLEAPKPTRIFNKNIKGASEYLQKLSFNYGVSDEEEQGYDVNWVYSDGKVAARPFPLKDLSKFGIDVMDYIVVENIKQVYLVDFIGLCDIIAFDIMFRDLGYTFREIEEKLSDIGLVSTYSSSYIESIFTECKPYKLSLELKTENPPLTEDNPKEVYGYFVHKRYKAGYYKDVVRGSCREAICLVLCKYIEAVIQNEISTELCYIDETRLAFKVGKSVDIDRLLDSVSIRTFGRQFEVVPKIIKY